MMMRYEDKIHLVECPRDAMQGWKDFISTEKKVEYLNALLQVGFDTLDFGSFVSAKAIPQLADTREVIGHLELGISKTKLLAIVANARGAEEAAVSDVISCMGFPFSVSPTFQQRNTNSTIEESFKRVEEIQSICVRNNKQLVVYMSMGFGNPYGDVYSDEIVYEWVHKITGLGINTISLADTVGLATPEQVFSITNYLIQQLPQHEIGVHLHSTLFGWKDKVDAALKAGCRRFDGALKGIGGCPMADDELVGNMDSEQLIPYFSQQNLLNTLNKAALEKSIQLATAIFA
jgi:hydroxymethylglutaryl-CoA lyase